MGDDLQNSGRVRPACAACDRTALQILGLMAGSAAGALLALALGSLVALCEQRSDHASNDRNGGGTTTTGSAQDR